MKLTADQQKALDALHDWYVSQDRSPFITLGGYAGTGKTTLIAELRKKLAESAKNIKIAFCSYTGKATQVLSQKLADAKIVKKGDSISTIHSLIYSAVLNKKGEIISWERKAELSVHLIIVDEASMVDQYIWQDLLSYRIPIIAVGDHGQLPPVQGSFNLMEHPTLVLEHIHRQAADNPIISVSQFIRERGTLPQISSNDHVRFLKRGSEESRETIGDYLAALTPETLLLCGFNATRLKLNTYVREMKERFTPIPQSGDRVICLKNNHQKEIYNGMLGTISRLEDDDDTWYYAKILMDGNATPYKGLILKEQFNQHKTLQTSREQSFGDLFDFGYALTVHKAQGSQAPTVILFIERSQYMKDDEWRRWLYTAVTRAEENLIVVEGR